MKRTTFYHKNFDHPNFVRSDELVTSIRVEHDPGHDYVTIWNRGGCSGAITVTKGDGEVFAHRLLGAHHIRKEDGEE